MSIEENKEARHKARQQKVKEQVDAKIAAAQEEKGFFFSSRRRHTRFANAER